MLIVSLLSCVFSPAVTPCRPITTAWQLAPMNLWSNLRLLAFKSYMLVANMRFIIACCASFAASNVSILLAPLLRLRCLLPNLFTALYHCCLSGYNFSLCSSCNGFRCVFWKASDILYHKPPPQCDQFFFLAAGLHLFDGLIVATAHPQIAQCLLHTVTCTFSGVCIVSSIGRELLDVRL